MPLYDYKCKLHGLFHQLATLEDSAQPGACPDCGELSARIILLAPEILTMKNANRTAHERNEKSANVPIFSTSDSREEQRREDCKVQARGQRKRQGKQGEYGQGRDCGCGDRPIRKSALMFTADGKKMFPSMRPWMISH